MIKMKPRTSFIVCATHRSGSGLLCDALGRTGLAGKPDEFFSPKVEKKYAKKWKTTTYSDYINKLIEESTSENGVFGAKMMWTHVGYFQKKFSEIPKYANLETQDLMDAIFPNLHYIWARRRDKVRQAVSFWKAQETGRFISYQERSPKVPKFNFKKINYLVHELKKMEQYWENYFKANGISPFIVIYEDDLEYEYKKVVKEVLAYLSIIMPDDLVFKTKFKKQSDRLSETFVRLYHEELKKRGEMYD